MKSSLTKKGTSAVIDFQGSVIKDGNSVVPICAGRLSDHSAHGE